MLIMEWRLKALRTNLDLKVSRDAPGGAKRRGRLGALRVSWEHRIVRPRDDLDLKVSRDAPGGASRGT